MPGDSPRFDLIILGKVFQIPNSIQTGKDLGMQLLDQALLVALHKKEIDPDDAYRYATDKRQFQRFVNDSNLLPRVSLAGS